MTGALRCAVLRCGTLRHAVMCGACCPALCCTALRFVLSGMSVVLGSACCAIMLQTLPVKSGQISGSLAGLPCGLPADAWPPFPGLTLLPAAALCLCRRCDHQPQRLLPGEMATVSFVAAVRRGPFVRGHVLLPGCNPCLCWIRMSEILCPLLSCPAAE